MGWVWDEIHLSSRQAFPSFTISQPGLEVGDDLGDPPSGFLLKVLRVCTFEDGLGLLGVLLGEEGLRRQHGQDGADPLPHRISAVAVDEALANLLRGPDPAEGQIEQPARLSVQGSSPLRACEHRLVRYCLGPA